MDLELHQLELRYEELRKRNPRQERRLVASLSEGGQQMPIVVVAVGGHRFVVIDGYKRVRAGEIAAHAAMKYLVPLARANAQAANRLAEAMASFRPTTRQVGLLYEGWQAGTERTRELILAVPQVYLKTLEVQQPPQAARS